MRWWRLVTKSEFEVVDDLSGGVANKVAGEVAEIFDY